MEGKQISDRNQSMMASRIFNDVLNTVQSSNLNFCLQISPFAANISLKKSFLKDKSGNVVMPDHAHTATSLDENIAGLVSKNLNLEKENSALRKDLEKSKDEYQEVYKQLKSLKVVEKELVEEIKVQKGITQEKNESENQKVKELEGEMKMVQARVDEYMVEIDSLKHAANVAREISNKLQKELSDTKLRFRDEKSANFKEHKSEVKAWKKKLGEANKEKIKLQNKQVEKKGLEWELKTETNNNRLSSNSSVSSKASSSKRSSMESAASSSTTQPASTVRIDSPPTPPPPSTTRACSPQTPPWAPPSRWSPSSVSTQVTTLAVTTRTCENTLQTSASTDSTSKSRTTSVSARSITEDYITGINQIDLGPRVNDLSKF